VGNGEVSLAAVGVWCLVRTITWIAYCVDTDLALIVLIVLSISIVLGHI
jgi:hypothetical protein